VFIAKKGRLLLDVSRKPKQTLSVSFSYELIMFCVFNHKVLFESKIRVILVRDIDCEVVELRGTSVLSTGRAVELGNSTKHFKDPVPA
jgi:hypothetical protein